jgi:hypothetical protein
LVLDAVSVDRPESIEECFVDLKGRILPLLGVGNTGCCKQKDRMSQTKNIFRFFDGHRHVPRFVAQLLGPNAPGDLPRFRSGERAQERSRLRAVTEQTLEREARRDDPLQSPDLLGIPRHPERRECGGCFRHERARTPGGFEMLVDPATLAQLDSSGDDNPK